MVKLFLVKVESPLKITLIAYFKCLFFEVIFPNFRGYFVALSGLFQGYLVMVLEHVLTFCVLTNDLGVGLLVLPGNQT